MDRAQGSFAGVAGNDSEDWGTKTQTLVRLAPLVRASSVPESLCIGFGPWCGMRTQVLAQIQLRFGQRGLAVRSSRCDEDQPTQSYAGRYRTELDVPAHDVGELSAAIDAVFRSYGACVANDEVLLQPMVKNARACFVAATHTLDGGAPYYVLDFASGTDTDIVTGGTEATTTFYLARDARHRNLDNDSRRVLRALRELEGLHNGEALEAEFVLAGRAVILLQVRPIVNRPPAQDNRSAVRQRHALARRLARHDRVQTGVYGRSTLYGLMPDWNPAELLGAHPRPLALSVFRCLITRANWRRARAALGYRALATGDLLWPLAGRPFVDIRLSFNSFLPEGIAPAVGARLVDAWLARLQAAPMLHDKVEFEIASTCVDFDFAAQHRTRYGDLLGSDELLEYRQQLLEPTRRCLDHARLAQAQQTLRRLHRELLTESQRQPDHSGLRRYLRRASQFAKLFAQIARQAFVAETLLRSAQRCGVLSAERMHALRCSIDGVAGEFMRAWSHADTPRAHTELRVRFGHLRPGTFEITVPCYAALAESFLAQSPPRVAAPDRAFALAVSERGALKGLLERSGLGIDAGALIAFYLAAVQAREYGKFVLSQSVSLLLESIGSWGAHQDLDRETLTWLDIDRIVAGIDESVDAYPLMAATARQRYESERGVRLPVLLAARDDLSIVRYAPGAPTYHGGGVVEARLVFVNRHTRPAAVPMHCIIAIESADPGFDWVFARAPVALLTAYGGPNSHMAIRCTELHCPAVLGYGAEGLRRVLRSARLTIDFDSGTLRGPAP